MSPPSAHPSRPGSVGLQKRVFHCRRTQVRNIRHEHRPHGFQRQESQSLRVQRLEQCGSRTLERVVPFDEFSGPSDKLFLAYCKNGRVLMNARKNRRFQSAPRSSAPAENSSSSWWNGSRPKSARSAISSSFRSMAPLSTANSRKQRRRQAPDAQGRRINAVSRFGASLA